MALVEPGLIPMWGGVDITKSLPTSLTTFIGREPELAQLHALLDDARLLTITGSGGCGKTRLALRAVVDRADSYGDGIWYVELAPLGETSSVVSALAEVLHLQGSGEESLLDSVVSRLRDDHALVVIDNCEHLLDEAALLVAALLRGCPPLQVLTTSRQPLNLPGEVTWRVPSMVAPRAGDVADIESLGSYDAVRLFVDRALRGRPSFAVTNDNAPHVATICEQLDGIPLAIELAAARVRNVSIERIASGLNDRFGLLRGGSSALLPRQQTLLASVEWSHQLLDEDERVLLRRLALFRGGFTLGAAEAVAPFDALDRYDVLDLLSSLVDRSLILLDDTRPHPRYRLLETIRQFARIRLDEADEVGQVLDRHLSHFARLAAERASELETGAQEASRAELERENENLNVALVHASTSDDPTVLADLAFDLVFYWFQTARFADGDQWLGQAEARLIDPGAVQRGRLLWGRGYLNYYYGNFPRSGELAQAAMEAGVAVDDPVASGRAMDLGGYLLQLADPLGTVPFLEEALALARTANDRWGEIDILQKIAFSHLFADRYDDAERSFDAAHDLGLCGSNPFFVAWHWNARTWIEHRRGHDVAAGASDAIAAADASGDLTTIAWAHTYAALALLRRGSVQPARELIAGGRMTVTERGGSMLQHFLLDLAASNTDLWTGVGDPAGVMRVHADYWRADHASIAETVAIEIVALGEILHGHPGAPRSVARLRKLGARLQSPLHVGLASLYDAVALMQAGDPDHAANACRTALHAWHGHSYDIQILEALDVLAWASAAGGQAETAGRLLTTTTESRRQRGWAVAAYEEQWQRSARDAVTDADAFRTGERSASDLTVDEAVALVTRSRGPRLRPLVGWPSLTPTEQAVVALVADGLSNPDIAERLFISRSTVKTHLHHAFTKLDISNRAELASTYTRESTR